MDFELVTRLSIVKKVNNIIGISEIQNQRGRERERRAKRVLKIHDEKTFYI